MGWETEELRESRFKTWKVISSTVDEKMTDEKKQKRLEVAGKGVEGLCKKPGKAALVGNVLLG